MVEYYYLVFTIRIEINEIQTFLVQFHLATNEITYQKFLAEWLSHVFSK